MFALSVILLIVISFIFGWIFAWLGLAFKIVTASKVEFDHFVNNITRTRNEHPDLWDEE